MLTSPQSLPIGIVAVLFMGFMSTVFLFPSSPTTSVQDMNYTVAVFGGVMVLSLIYYYFPKYGGVYWFTGPIKNVEKRREGSMEGSFDDIQKDRTNVAAVRVS